jgi:hypothetical protein
MSIHSPNALMASWKDLSAHMERSGFFRSIRGNPGPAVGQFEQPFSRSAVQVSPAASGTRRAVSGQKATSDER